MVRDKYKNIKHPEIAFNTIFALFRINWIYEHIRLIFSCCFIRENKMQSIV